MKKNLLKLTFILSLLLLTLIPLSVSAERAFGELTCDIDYQGTLTISGTGEMLEHPWYNIIDDWKDDIKRVVISNGVTTVCENAFEGCSNLESVSMADTVTAIGYKAFAYCRKLSNITLSKNLTTIDHFAFFRCKNLMTLSIPETINFIGNGIFSESGIENFTLPNNIETIPEYMFDGCINLQKIDIPNSVKTIGDSAFRWCTSLENIKIPNSLQIIDAYAFHECDKLNNVILPESVTTIGHHAFFGCDSLTNIYIPNTVREISYKVFNNSGYYNNSENWTNGILYINNHLISTDNTITECNIKDGTITIANESLCSYSGGENIKTIYIPKSVEYISEGCFKYYLSTTIDIYYDGYKKEWEELISATYNLDKFETINIHCLPPSISTELTNNIFVVTPKGVKNGNRVIFVCYNGNKMVYVNPYVYAGETTIPFSTTETYDKVKVMVWESLDTYVPLCEAENVPLN